MQNELKTTNVANANVLTLVGDYVIPDGLINFQAPANMVMEYMLKVQQNPHNEEYKATLKALTEGAKLVVSAGVAQVEQGQMMIDLLRVNDELNLWRKKKS